MRRNAVKWCVVVLIVGAAIFFFSPARRPAYDLLEAELVAEQNASPGGALKLAETLMRDYPSECMPYQIAANVYTLQKKYTLAESVLQSAIETCKAPPELYVRMAHFYQRVMPEKHDEKIGEMLNRPAVRNSPVLIAKLLCIGGRQAQAVHYLENTSPTFETTMMLSRLYAEQKRYDHAGRLLMDMPDIQYLDRGRKSDLMAAMFSLPAPLDRRKTGFCLDLILETVAPEADYIACRRHLSENLDTLMAHDPDHHTADLLQAGLSQKNHMDLRVWLGTIYLQKIERPKAAYEALKGYKTADARVLEEKARLAVHGSDVDEIRGCWQRLLTMAPNNNRVRLAYANILNRSDLIAEGRQILADMEQAGISETLRQPYYSLRIDNDAAMEDYEALVDTWMQAGRFYTYDEFLVLKDLIFSRLPETDQHRRLLAALEAKTSKTSPKNPAADLLHLFIAEQLRDMDLYFFSADVFFSRQTMSDTRTIDTFVQKTINHILSSSLPDEATGTEKPDLSQAMHFAAKWSAYLVEQHPGNPTYRVGLIVSDYIQGRIRDLEERCNHFLKDNENNHRQLALVARMLFRIGQYRLSSGYYQKAVDLRPDILRYQLGLADCLVRLRRYPQAGKIYFRMLTHPTTARTWDVGIILERLWSCYEKPEISDEFIDLVETLKKQPALNPDTLREAAGTLLLKKGRYKAAEKQFAEYIQHATEDEGRYGVYLKLATCHALQNDYEAAIGIYTECLRKYSGDGLKTIDCFYNRAEMKRRKGDYQAAIEDWKRIAKRFPTDEVASEALLMAATVAHDMLGDQYQAKDLYKACFQLVQPHSQMARIVKEKSADMDGNRSKDQ